MAVLTVRAARVVVVWEAAEAMVATVVRAVQAVVEDTGDTRHLRRS